MYRGKSLWWVIFGLFAVLLCAGPFCGNCRADADPNIEMQVEAMLSQMTLADKVGQMLMVAQNEVTAADVTTYRIGAILINVGANASLSSPTQWADRFDAYQNGALATPLAIPLLVATDAVHGHNNAYGATIFPHNIGLGATCDPNLMYRIGKIAALEVAATGCDMTLAPCVAVPRDIRWGRTYEGWGEVPEICDDLVEQMIRGYQQPYNGLDFIACTAKHYIADGGTAWGTGVGGKLDQGDCLLTEEQLRAIHLPPYLEALDANCQAIMPSYGKYQGLEMHHHQYLLTDVLKTELSFDGLIVSDYGGIYGIGADARTSIKSAVNAGIDMSMENTGWLTFITELTDLANTGEVPMTRIDDAVRRILRVKYRAKVFDQPLADRTVTNSGTFGSDAHREVAREAASKSCVLLKNEGSVLPLKKNIDVLVAGPKADDMSVQCGGWTIEWGGAEPTQLPPGTTVLGAIEYAVGYIGTCTYSEDGTGGADKDAAIVVVGERPYAEWNGDTASLDLVDSTDLTAIANVTTLSIPKILIVLAGRPIDIDHIVDDFDAVIMAWLPGTEGQGVADLLFGNQPFTGVLSHTWMKDEAQLPMHPEDAYYDPLYPLGHGLTTIEFDSASSAADGVGPTSSLSWPHTIGIGENRALVVGVTMTDSSPNIGSVTYNGVEMTEVTGSSSSTGDFLVVDTGLYYLLDSDLPTAGTYTVQVTTHAGDVDDIVAGAVSLFNVKQQPAEVVEINAQPGGSAVSTEVATLSEGAWLIDVVAGTDPCAPSAGVLQTGRWAASGESSAAACSTRPMPAARTVSMKWAKPAPSMLAQSVAAFAPVQKTHPMADLNNDFLLDWQDVMGFVGQWNPGVLPDSAPLDLAANWRFDEGTGTLAADSVGGNDGATNADWVKGKSQTALHFDGGQTFSCADDSSLDLANNFTISLWAKLEPNQAGALINKGYSVGASDPNGAYTLAYDPAGEGSMTFTLRKSDNVATQSIVLTPFAADDWTHIVAYYKYPYMRLYINGAPVKLAVFTAPTIRTNNENLGIGGYADGTHAVSGAIDDVRIYSRALSKAEIEDMLPCALGETCADLDMSDGVNWTDYAQLFGQWNP